MIDILCVGNPDLIGDSIGPRVGTALQKLGCEANVVGTLDDPVLNSNYTEQLKKLRHGATIIVVDSVVGNEVGEIKLQATPMTVGAAVIQWSGTRSGKTRLMLQSVGDYSMKIVTAESVYNLFTVTEKRATALAAKATAILLDAVNNYTKYKYI